MNTRAVGNPEIPSVPPARVEEWQHRIRIDLWDRVIPFWMEHSPDPEFGGYFNCLDKDGTPFDTKKHVWLQARQVWMFSKLFTERGDERFLALARSGAEFLEEHATGPDGRAFFALARDGAPVALQRKIFSECFLVMAFAEYARASGDSSYRVRALELFDKVQELVRNPSGLGRPILKGQRPTSELAVPMILLNLVAELRGDPGSETFDDREDYDELETAFVQSVMRHLDEERGLVFETVAPDGKKLLESPEGRLINPGHVIETGWFLARYAQRISDAALEAKALSMIQVALDFGWDEAAGGISYFLDSEGYSPVQLEWSMKLWWPHCEAMIGTLIAWRSTGDAAWFERFERVATYAFEHFSDQVHGEWYGYLDRSGQISQRFKGGPYKGCFHVPRALWMCERLLATP